MSPIPAEPSAPGARRRSLLQRLDDVRPPAAAGLGVTLGLLAGALAGSGLSLASPLALLLAASAFLALVAGALAIAFSARPISVVDGAPPGAADEPLTPVTPLTPVDPDQPVQAPEPPEPPEPPAPPTPPAAARRTLSVALIDIPAGRFRMGSPPGEAGRDDDEGPLREVTLDAFACMPHPVTRGLYRKLMPQIKRNWIEKDADDWPANRISWYDAVQFCNRLSDEDGLARCYEIEGTNVTWQHAADGYRLPTEAEWEYACRAGSETRYSFGDDAAELVRHAWYSANADGHPHAVGGLAPNAWGLHDMHGNVWEWCWDWFGDYPAEAEINPVGPVGGTWRVLRGGSFAIGAEVLRSAFRNWFRPEFGDEDFGFRCVRGPRRQP
ncbi:formylglycine-generating enzyme family protein [Accumulibacter sp.]|uniref:formylglycine-generating enzyme family protein n=1 Tax=Accumulibacter sp. TaxID=2053492 RepID=UPI002BA1A9AB|nr:formylglycine-generating enzyme family protein [Accumulibacter sp.]HNG14947.1 formylglycine-generating enzyme family protein [Accumulibacter sp.]